MQVLFTFRALAEVWKQKDRMSLLTANLYQIARLKRLKIWLGQLSLETTGKYMH